MGPDLKWRGQARCMITQYIAVIAMLGSNPSADSVASTDRVLEGDATRHPSFLFEELLIGKASKR